MAWYFTVYEFAERLTRHEAMWLPLGVISSNTAKGIPGGLSHVFKVMMKQLFEVEKIQDEGVILELDEPMRFFFKMRIILLDGERIAQSEAARGPLVSCVAFGASIASAIATLQHEMLASLMYRSATSANSLSPATTPFGAKWIL